MASRVWTAQEQLLHGIKLKVLKMYLQHFAVSTTSPRLPYLQQYLQQVPGYRSSFTQPNDYFHIFLDKKHDKQIMETLNLFSTKKLKQLWMYPMIRWNNKSVYYFIYYLFNVCVVYFPLISQWGFYKNLIRLLWNLKAF